MGKPCSVSGDRGLDRDLVLAFVPGLGTAEGGHLAGCEDDEASSR